MHSIRRKWFAMLMIVLLGATCLSAAVGAEGGVSLYTPYTSITVAPGESISYSIDVINGTSDIQTVGLSVDGVPDKWKSELTAGGRTIDTIAVKPKDTQSVTLQVTVPVQVEKGTYHFQVNSPEAASLPLAVTVSETGTYTTELVTKQPNMQGDASSTFNYSTTLNNKTAGKQLFALKADPPQGWTVQFQVNSKNVTSVDLDAGASQDISITVTPPDKVKAGDYKIPVTASAGASTASTELDAVVTGTYAIELSTPDGNLNTDITAGSTKSVTLKITNKGSAPLNDIDLSASTPANWDVVFSPQKIKTLPAGQSTQAVAQIKADKNAIAGDYMLTMTAKTAEKSSDAQFRITVHTSVLWGWIGVLIILAVLGGVYSLFQKYGRR